MPSQGDYLLDSQEDLDHLFFFVNIDTEHVIPLLTMFLVKFVIRWITSLHEGPSAKSFVSQWMMTWEGFLSSKGFMKYSISLAVAPEKNELLLDYPLPSPTLQTV